jgi:3-hydroxyisobutyrate dehydrogenase-like beta-hydroxyacid dehydrogenase
MTERVAFLGLGALGSAMAATLARSGVAVEAWNRTPRRFEDLRRLGVQLHSSPEAAVEDCGLVQMCLLDEHASRQVIAAMLPSLTPGGVVVDHATIGPRAARELAARVADKGAQYLDAPVSGGVSGAKEAALTIMVGGDQDAFERARPLLSRLGRVVHYMGRSGAGQSAKLVNQLLTAVNQAAAVEAARLATSSGQSLTKLHEVIQRSFGASAMLDRTFPVLRDRRFDTSFKTSLLAKDLRLVGELEREAGVELPVTGSARELYADAVRIGLGDYDAARLFDVLGGDGDDGRR